jgi:hypothetical protein
LQKGNTIKLVSDAGWVEWEGQVRGAGKSKEIPWIKHCPKQQHACKEGLERELY